MSQLLLGATIVLLILVAIISLDVMGLAFWKGNQFPVEGKTVLLTGSSQGMGREIARLLSARGANLILVARTTKNLESALEHAKVHAKNPSSQRFTYISADVTSESENARILAEATAWNNGNMPEIVWCIAGASTPGLFIETSTDTLRRQMDLNYFAAAYLAQKTLQAWLYPEVPYENGSHGKSTAPEPPRKFIITSSALAFVGILGYSPYAPAKAALRSLADGLRSEVQMYNAARRSSNTTTGQVPAPFDVNIHVIFPGTILSPGFENEEKTKHPVTRELETTDPKQTELEAATTVVNGLEGGNFMTATNWVVHLLRWGAIGSSQKNNIVLDTLGVWIATIVWLIVVPDLNSKVWNWGKKNGMPLFKQNAQ
ncbi:3-ketosphinganine reductase-like protein [Cucurbitaria berberidis CBS 394.84]|uniref:3-dehydrosphinganine reductase n=1 Tax=Cucurbitaria berberidis CBS 394.84 TaxID=1168544 RepID=A0A9P4L475_9PLEO|nr:3-ketosphinganine reductase-like protein [Cucurbitaria berberidis CBS 394.84]KAF1841012.1 3-ketosphinganine reductase-like protein [Cucurbitaria berberidis CBS 394.84]